MADDFRVQRIDHVELFVPDRYEAAEWYRRIFGLRIAREYEGWASHRGGPLVIAGDDGNVKLALFEGGSRDPRETAGFRRVAFGVDGPGFLRFLDRLSRCPVYDDKGRRLTPQDVVDHGKTYSVYFRDPYGHRFEITTPCQGEVSTRLSNLGRAGAPATDQDP